MTYQQALEYLASLNKFGINLGLTRIEKLLELMGNPEKQYKTLHVTGTNGKGSTTAMLSNILTAAGIKTGMYISPHLLEYTERMVIDGQPVTPEEFAESVALTSKFVNEMVAGGWEHPTEFEILTAAAFHWFAKSRVEYAVIEVGLGGLLDSTNVIRPEVAVITNVTLEHTDRCGNTVAEIARHKAGIIKEGIPVVTAAQGSALEVLIQTAEEKSAALYVLGRDFSGQFEGIHAYRQKISIQTFQDGNLGAFTVNLLGRHQVENTAVAIMAAMLLAKADKRIALGAVHSGVSSVYWPCRFEVIAQSPVTVLDGAHNPDGARVLRDTLDEVFPGRQVIFVLGILRDKNIKGIIANLVRPGDEVVVVRPESDRAGQPAEIAQELIAARVTVAESLADGITTANQWAGVNDVICITGSLYLVGPARQILQMNNKSGNAQI